MVLKKTSINQLLLKGGVFILRGLQLTTLLLSWSIILSVYLQASIKITKLLVDFDIALPSLGFGDRDLSLSPVTTPMSPVVTIHLPGRDFSLPILRYGRWQSTTVHLCAHH